MFDTSKTYFFGVTTDAPETKKQPETCPYAVGDGVYYTAPGSRQGELYFVKGWYRNENGRAIVIISRVRELKEEVVEATLSRLHC